MPIRSRLPIRPLRFAAVLGAHLLLAPAGAQAAVEAPGEAERAADAATDPPLESVTVIGHRLGRIEQRNEELDEARRRDLLPGLGASAYVMDAQAMSALPQGANTPLDKVLLRVPGVSYDSAVSNPDFHVRNEYANVQYRLNGIQLPDGVSALGPVLETSFIARLDLLDGVLPAQYGLRTAGVVDISTRTRPDPGGSLELYAGSRATFSPSAEVGGVSGDSQYYATARYLRSDEGLENAMPTREPIHDRTTQGKFFGYGSTLLGDATRLTYMAGGFAGRFQIPTVAGLAPLGDYGPATGSSADIDERETDSFYFAVLALQSHADATDLQVSAYTRYATVEFVPDVPLDLAFNDVASQVSRRSLAGGVQLDGAWRPGSAHTLRAGATLGVERTRVQDLSTVLPLDANGEPLPEPLTVNDLYTKLGWTVGGYLQDEWRLRPDLTLNAGLRLDRINQFVSAGQLSPRLSLVWQPLHGTGVHGGVARYFTPPLQAQSTPNNLALFQSTTQQPAIAQNDPVRPERATYLDVGVDQDLAPGLSAGVDAYYKRATDTLDDGQFGQAVVLDQYNYARGYSRGIELKLNLVRDGLRAYLNLSHEITMVRQVSSHQYLIGDPVLLAYLAGHYAYASDAQTVTGSAGAAYRHADTLVTVDGLYGSGLRAGFANEQHSGGYTQWNAALGQDFHPWGVRRPLTVRLSAVNVFDRTYLLRSGTGVGEFAPQYGPRRGVYLSLTQAF